MTDLVVDKPKYSFVARADLKPPQKEMLKWMCILIVLQWVILFTVVQIIHYLHPEWVDINLLLVILVPIALLFVIYLLPHDNPLCTVIRVLAFLGLGVIMSFVLSSTYNITLIRTPPQDKERVRRLFLFLWVGVIVFFGVVVGTLPLLLPLFAPLQILGVVLSLAVLFLLIALIFIPASEKSFMIWLFISVIVFTFLIITDTVTVIARCETEKTIQCDPITGATTVYFDMINLLQKLFVLLSGNK